MDKKIISKINKELKDAKKVKIKEIDAVKLSNGILKVNAFYYFMTYKEKTKYNENMYTFRKFDIDKFQKDIKNEKFKDIENYIDDCKLDVIEDSTYKIKEVMIIKE